MSYLFDGDREHDPLGTSHDFNRRILIMAIVSLSVVMVIVLALHLYARFFLTRRRRAAIYQLSLSHENANANAESHNTGLDPNLINSLPTFPFKQLQQQQPDEDPVECAVCLSVLQHGEYLKLLPNCKHSFHLGCIDTWLASHSTCPICRSKVQPVRLEPQPREGPTGSVLDVVVVAVAPTVEKVEGTSNAANDDNNNNNGSPKISGSNPRFSSFRRILSRDSSFTRIQPSANVDVEQDFQRL